LEPPRLSRRQAGVEDALKTSIGRDAITPRYPMSGGFRSPFVFYDLDGDGREEAIAFFTYNSSPDSIRARIFKEDEAGNWVMAYDLSGLNGIANRVDFIDFSYILSDSHPSILVGWRERNNATTFGVYTFIGGALRTEYESRYEILDISDYHDNELNQIAFVRRDFAGDLLLNLFGKISDGRFAELGSVYLSTEADEILSIKNGALRGSNRGIFIDIMLRDSTVATEVYEVSQSTLAPVISEDSELFQMTFRESAILSSGPDENGIVEIPRLVDLPGHVPEYELSPPPLTVFMRPARIAESREDGSVAEVWTLDEARSVVINNEDGYLVHFPDNWIGNVTVLLLPLSNEWKFHKVDHATNLTTVELLRIRVSSVTDWQDRMISDYTTVGEKGLYRYHAFIPPTTTSEPLAIEAHRLDEIFELL